MARRRSLLAWLGLTTIAVSTQSVSAEPAYIIEMKEDGGQLLLPLTAAGQQVNLYLDSMGQGIRLFQYNTSACPLDKGGKPAAGRVCFDPLKAENGTCWCKTQIHQKCIVDPTRPSFKCACMNQTDEHSFQEYPYSWDGVEYEEHRQEGTGSVSIDLPSAAPGSPSAVLHFAKEKAALKLINNRTQHQEWPLFMGAGDGLWGLSGRSLSCRNESVFSDLLASVNATSFAFDVSITIPTAPADTRKDSHTRDHPIHSRRRLNKRKKGAAALGGGGHKNELHIGGWTKKYGPIAWSERKQTGGFMQDALPQFVLYHPSVCGADLLYNDSSNWVAAVDTGAECLGLPSFIWERLMAWLPVDCPDGKPPAQPAKKGERPPPQYPVWRYRDTHPTLCSPRKDARPLPVFQFRLSEDEEGPRLNIPLESLVRWNASSKREELCVSGEAPAYIIGRPLEYTTSPYMTFGTYVLNNLYYVVNDANNTIGFAQKNLKAAGSDAFCAMEASCLGSQTYYRPRNVCLDPTCSKWYFKTLDAHTKECRYFSSLPAMAVTILVLLACTDLWGHHLYKLALQKARAICR
ncbi:unnamed protein product [Vitrella brassicaformis CCMP3155]|uniref:Peptidase A1 domain-containing protein n=2 Tax=Vitrella brassicaformis TaxID=1169539 RepID=A0A0G4GVN1_VITBC|nr:unnamed protein product [Vitrella brassicaformis CCMP3155]|mmetsp:Transcript_2054/g.4606  ORF Transcript_2054/g.4606 Transcript_2054/m.4606 type:complete len:575 (+) Transcript_2054:79-1803(+)|eukprot:CEM35009.1 unnamed protein product [Vitrella brassicaformis CCMP3155]